MYSLIQLRIASYKPFSVALIRGVVGSAIVQFNVPNTTKEISHQHLGCVTMVKAQKYKLPY